MGKRKWKNNSGTPTYNSWKSMRNRVLSEAHTAHSSYKDRLICPRWLNNYDAFFEDMGERPFNTTLDRIDNSKGYDKENCRWVSMRVQQNNKDFDYLTSIEKDGVVKTIVEWAFELELTKEEKERAYKRHASYNAKTFEELFCKNLKAYRTSQRVNKCQDCGTTETCKWRRHGKQCNTCYHKNYRTKVNIKV